MDDYETYSEYIRALYRSAWLAGLAVLGLILAGLALLAG